MWHKRLSKKSQFERYPLKVVFQGCNFWPVHNSLLVPFDSFIKAGFITGRSVRISPGTSRVNRRLINQELLTLTPNWNVLPSFFWWVLTSQVYTRYKYGWVNRYNSFCFPRKKTSKGGPKIMLVVHFERWTYLKLTFLTCCENVVCCRTDVAVVAWFVYVYALSTQLEP